MKSYSVSLHLVVLVSSWLPNADHAVKHHLVVGGCGLFEPLHAGLYLGHWLSRCSSVIFRVEFVEHVLLIDEVHLVWVIGKASCIVDAL